MELQVNVINRDIIARRYDQQRQNGKNIWSIEIELKENMTNRENIARNYDQQNKMMKLAKEIFEQDYVK